MPSSRVVPADGSRAVCPDTPLTVFGRDLDLPRRIRIRSRDGSDLIDIEPDADGDSLRTIGDALDDRGLLHRFSYRAVIRLDPSAVHPGGYRIFPPRVLRPATDYCIEIEDRVAWTFRTREPLSSVAGVFGVAADGSRDFCTVQAAIDAARHTAAAAPDHGRSVTADQPVPNLIDVAAGSYREICFLGEDCPPLTVRGAGRGRTVLCYDNNNSRNGRPSASRCRNRLLGDRDLYNGWRANVGVDAPDIRFEDLTLINTTEAGGSQAEAFRGNQQRLVLNRVELIGHQDTLRMQGQAFVSHCRITGTVDFVWGAGAVFHWHNEFRSRGPGYVFQVRNDADHRGHLLLDCRFTAESGVDDRSVYVARSDTTAFPYSELIMIYCRLGEHLHPDLGTIAPNPAARTVRFAAHNSFGPTSGSGADLASGPSPADPMPPVFHRLSRAEAGRDADPATFLDGWVPHTLNAEADQVPPGRSLAVHWSAPSEHDPRDRIEIAGRSVDVGSGASLGTSEIVAPSAPGRYLIRYRPVDRSRAAAVARLEVVG